MNHSPFHELQAGRAPEGYALHNVRLLDVLQGDAGDERLIADYQGETAELQGGRWHERSRFAVGQVGCLVPAPALLKEFGRPAVYFRAYLDQSLRRAPELDAPDSMAAAGQTPNVVGWRCDARPAGFRGPVGLVPGEHGDFVPDASVAVTLQVPPEFVRLSRQYQHSPSSLLRAFVGDVCGLMNYVRCPRADRYGSNGSDERDLADHWLERAFAHQRIDVDAEDADDAQPLDEDVYPDAEEVEDLLQEYQDLGGDPQEILAAVRRLVDQKREQD